MAEVIQKQQVHTSTAHPREIDYLSDGNGIKDWLFTVDHKRIGIMYLFFVLQLSWPADY